MSLETLTLEKDGAQLFRGVLSKGLLTELEQILAGQPADQAGVRLCGVPRLAQFLATTSPVGRIPASWEGAGCKPVRAILFDKSAAQNWSLAWHQDRTIAVAERREVPGFGPWTIKSGIIHVEPPFSVMADMLTVRVHLDAVPENNAPLLIAPGSHRYGRVRVEEISRVVDRCGTVTCLAEAGDVWLYATPILHASEAAIVPAHRRVLQVDYAAGELPGGLRWLGI